MAHKRLKQQSFHDSPPDQSRFSTLPEELKDKILDYFSFEDAARTGILSSTSNWSEHPQLILDKHLFAKRCRWIAPYAIAWMQKVAEILKNHPKGPIRKFILHIPDLPLNWELYINIWIAFLSWKDIKVLSLDNCNITTYKLSSYLSRCYELTRLELRNCAFYKSFGSFQNLQFLCLEEIAFGSVEVGDVELSTPSLVEVQLFDCTGFRYLNIRAPKLKNFVFAISGGMDADDLIEVNLKRAHCETTGKPRIHLVCIFS